MASYRVLTSSSQSGSHPISLSLCEPQKPECEGLDSTAIARKSRRSGIKNPWFTALSSWNSASSNSSPPPAARTSAPSSCTQRGGFSKQYPDIDLYLNMLAGRANHLELHKGDFSSIRTERPRKSSRHF
ncbi:hypothetical protein RRG08_061735 [Elysia crispata]|uniref:Uncharacterized protein n=1 Tax=Elysia crispata TaxID=231223 RepID=A0AAE1DU77_9GAST|nr:hypothetical protein RRG08_061735 [Elysia crispata]